ncbi:hypothetical protein RJT34_11003 [Clitoria ternatea]|uniref:DYW domain-containing protein n=1 Tax=Clitoria ternatea TaxID=43366 RepID=A0AAN9JL90_CLITE
MVVSHWSWQIRGSVKERNHVVHLSTLRVLTACNLANLPQPALSISRSLLRTGFHPDHFVFSSFVKACASLGPLHVKQGKQVYAWFLLSPFSDDDVVKSSLVDMYAKLGLPHYRRAVFDSISSLNSISWTAMISGYARSGRKFEAFQLFRETPYRNLFAWTALISGLVKSGMELMRSTSVLELGKQIHGLVITLGYESCLFIGNSLIDVAEMALALYDDMVLAGVKPNEVTFVGLMYACSHAGLVSKGHALSGHLDEAENLIRTMSFNLDEPTWAALLSACKHHGDTKMAVRIADHLLKIKPEDPSSYILLSNIYAGAGLWENVSKVRKVMMVMEVKKEPGYSCVDLGKESHVFYAGETSHPMKDEIIGLMRKLDAEMRKRGYVPDTSSVLHDMDRQEKERQLFMHSERLAVAYGLLKAVPRTIILVVKNLRVCEDCHTVLKLISTIANREIHDRDAKRYHHFKDGNYSCNDFW